jgi:hypothetical protein
VFFKIKFINEYPDIMIRNDFLQTVLSIDDEIYNIILKEHGILIID